LRDCGLHGVVLAELRASVTTRRCRARAGPGRLPAAGA
jgi:hypothetical protein